MVGRQSPLVVWQPAMALVSLALHGCQNLKQRSFTLQTAGRGKPSCLQERLPVSSRSHTSIVGSSYWAVKPFSATGAVYWPHLVSFLCHLCSSTAHQWAFFFHFPALSQLNICHFPSLTRILTYAACVFTCIRCPTARRNLAKMRFTRHKVMSSMLFY